MVLLCSCAPQKQLNRKLDRAERFARKHGLVVSDTITIRDTIIVESYSIDTVTKIETHDTVTVINNDRVRLEYIYIPEKQTIEHFVECKEDTVFYTKMIPVDRITKVEKEKTPIWVWILVGALALIAVLALRKK